MILNKMAESFGVTFMTIMDHENDTLVNTSSQVSPMHVTVSISHSKVLFDKSHLCKDKGVSLIFLLTPN